MHSLHLDVFRMLMEATFVCLRYQNLNSNCTDLYTGHNTRLKVYVLQLFE